MDAHPGALPDGDRRSWDSPNCINQRRCRGWRKRPARLSSWQVVTECFLLGSLVAQAPFYSGILQGLQVSDVTPYS